MEDARDRTIQKQSYAIVCLTLLVGVLLILVIYLAFFWKTETCGTCGVSEKPVGLCGNAGMEEARYEAARKKGFTGDAKRGKYLWKANCAVCHALNDQRLTGPGLRGIEDRVPPPPEEYLVKYILNEGKLVREGDPYAKKVRHDYGNIEMTVFDSVLTENETRDIIAYMVSSFY